jgi:hypothetical protein
MAQPTIDKLSPARGFLVGAGICSAFWLAILLLFI